jgi:hypothetical protein
MGLNRAHRVLHNELDAHGRRQVNDGIHFAGEPGPAPGRVRFDISSPVLKHVAGKNVNTT